MSGFYLNELLLKLTHRHDPVPGVFDAYHTALEGLKAGAVLESTLRLFEKRLLDLLGYGLELEADAHTGASIDGRRCVLVDFRPAHGLVPAAPDAPGALSGASLIGLAREELTPGRQARGCEAPVAGGAGALPGRAGAQYAHRGAFDCTISRISDMTNKFIALGVNIDHVATLRQARRARYPDPVRAGLDGRDGRRGSHHPAPRA